MSEKEFEDRQNFVGDQQAHGWAAAIHLSQFAHCLLPGAGFVVPIVIWQMKKREIPALGAHGKNVINWWISVLLYSVVGAIFCLMMIGTPLMILGLPLIVLPLLSLIYPLIGAIKASKGKVWKYPGTITFV